MACTDVRMTMTRFVELHKITADVKYGVKPSEEVTHDPWQRASRQWTVTLKRGRRRLTVPFYQGQGHRDELTPADVLGRLMLDAMSGEQSFEDWCSDAGTDTDSRAAKRIHDVCRRMAPRLRRFLGEALYDAARDAEH